MCLLGSTGHHAAQARAEQVGEEVVIAVPAPLAVKGDEEEVRPFQSSSVVWPSGDRCAAGRPRRRRSRRVGRDRGFEQESWVAEAVARAPRRSDSRRRSARCPAKAAMTRARSAPADRAARARRVAVPPPIPRSLDERPHAGGSSGGGAIDRGGSPPLRGETEIVGANFDQVAARPQPRQGERRVGARGDHEVESRRQVVEQVGHGLLDRRRGDQVVIVEDERDIARQAC